MCNEYIINIATSSGTEIFKIYNHTEPLAIKSFIQACEDYAKTGKEEARAYWKDLIGNVGKERYTIFQNYDFRGISKVV